MAAVYFCVHHGRQGSVLCVCVFVCVCDYRIINFLNLHLSLQDRELRPEELDGMLCLIN